MKNAIILLISHIKTCETWQKMRNELSRHRSVGKIGKCNCFKTLPRQFHWHDNKTMFMGNNSCIALLSVIGINNSISISSQRFLPNITGLSVTSYSRIVREFHTFLMLQQVQRKLFVTGDRVCDDKTRHNAKDETTEKERLQCFAVHQWQQQMKNFTHRDTWTNPNVYRLCSHFFPFSIVGFNIWIYVAAQRALFMLTDQPPPPPLLYLIP